MYLGKDEKLPLVLSMSFGLQHMLAMCVGIATSGGMLHANEACFSFNYDSQMCDAQSFLVSCSWFASGLLTMIQVFRLKIRGTPFSIGTGLVSVMGTSFTFLPMGQQMVSSSIGEAKGNGDERCVADQPYKGNPDVLTTDCRGVAVEAYGKFLGTAMVASLFEVGVALAFNTKFVQKYLFPPVVFGMAVLMIGGALIASGIKYLGGGVFCAQNTQSKVPVFGGPHVCNESGDVFLVYGASEYWGIGLSVVFFGVFIQCLGSPFLKSTFLFWSMMFGCLVSIATVKDEASGEEFSFWNPKKIDNAPVITFPWTKVAFAPGFAPEYFLPLLICSYITTAETVGDVEMTAKFSKVTDPQEVNDRKQGGVMADGVNSIVACLLGSPPNTTFSQNNGILSLTKCASRSAGFACAGWLMFIGIFGKIGGAMASVPMPVVGGVILQCFTMVFVAGMQILGPLLTVRRNSYIVMVSVAFGLGVAMEPQTVAGNGVSSFHGKNLDFNYGLWPGYMVCKKFFSEEVEVTPASCVVVDVTSNTMSADDCALMGGTYTAAVTEMVEQSKDPHNPGSDKKKPYCVTTNGKCCAEWDKGAKSVRTSLILILKSPYGIAVLIAALLNALIPFEKDEDEDEEEASKPKDVEVASTEA
jgi:NCS2 family nucleobase:cation symporter-2